MGSLRSQLNGFIRSFGKERRSKRGYSISATVPMPFFDQPLPPAMPGRPPYEHDVVKKWTDQIAASDGFVFVLP